VRESADCPGRQLGDLSGDTERLFDGNRTSGDALVRALTVNELEHEELCAIDFFEAVNLSDVGMVERREDLGFTTEAGDALRIVGERSWQNLQRDIAPELRVFGAVDLP